jgi:hypothetical protein
MGVAPFLGRLFVEVPGKMGQGLKIKMSADGVVLQGRGKFHSDLAVDRLDDFFGNKHATGRYAARIPGS